MIMTNNMISRLGADEFGAAYTRKDSILYALAVGFGSSEEEEEGGKEPSSSADAELIFLYEHHPNFVPIPTFCFALSFWADRGVFATTYGLPLFPPPTMSSSSSSSSSKRPGGEIVPRQLVKDDNLDLSTLPVIHTWQSVVWHQSLPVPKKNRLLRSDDDINSKSTSSSRCDGVVRTKLDVRTITVLPKSIGTFVTTETNITLGDHDDEHEHEQNGGPPLPHPTILSKNGTLICTLQSTALILGAPRDQIMPYDSGTPIRTSQPQIPENRRPLLEWVFPTTSNQALLYRLASGDTNHIHVDDSASQMLGSETKAPLLHGLCTFGIVYRALFKLMTTNNGNNEKGGDETIHKLEGKLTQPVFVGDILCVKIWNAAAADDESISNDNKSKRRYVFVVCNQKSGATVVDCGSAEIGPTNSNEQRIFPTIVSKL